MKATFTKDGERFCFYTTKYFHECVKKSAEKQGTTMSNILRNAIYEYIKKDLSEDEIKEIKRRTQLHDEEIKKSLENTK